MERWPPAVEASGDHYCRVVCGDRIDAATHERVQRAVAALQAADLEAVDNLHPAYATVGVSFDPRRVTAEAMRVAIAAAAREAAAFELPPARRIEVPVAYGAEWGPDLDAVARHVGITPEEVVARHARAGYIVHFLGFSPGFPYPVSYTHLRAHETVLDLVCRLLLEKKKNKSATRRYTTN